MLQISKPDAVAVSLDKNLSVNFLKFFLVPRSSGRSLRPLNWFLYPVKAAKSFYKYNFDERRGMQRDPYLTIYNLLFLLINFIEKSMLIMEEGWRRSTSCHVSTSYFLLMNFIVQSKMITEEEGGGASRVMLELTRIVNPVHLERRV